MSIETQLDILLRLTVALVLGAIIGIEREYRGHPAGVRTMAMVSVGSCIFTASGLFIFSGHNTDPTRIAAQVVTGVGFLGAGAIFRAETGIRGLTTAAAVWVVAAIGMTVGFGLYLLAAGAATVVLVGLVLVRPIELHFFSETSRHPLRRRDDSAENTSERS
ncbi:MAG TPA: MgtC/SapB family protein [Candidatus Dormibacteraeota bacterium]|nr:MgtC/SapB family protein [Candidatus Dormibacteraeota bacterium]